MDALAAHGGALPAMAVAALAAHVGGRLGRLWRREAWSLCWLKSPVYVEYAVLDRSLLGSSGVVLVDSMD